MAFHMVRATMPRPPDAERRAALLAAAGRWLASHGSVGFSLRELARGIGETHRALLHHFGSKERLFLEVLTESRRRERSSFLQEAAGHSASRSPVELLRHEWARLSSPRQETFLRLYYDVLIAAMREPKRFREHLDVFGNDWIQTVAQLAEEVGIERRRAQSVGTFVLAGVRGLLLDLMVSGDRKRVERGFDDFAQAVEAFVAATAAGSLRSRRERSSVKRRSSRAASPE